jgi:hypothetical protein
MFTCITAPPAIDLSLSEALARGCATQTPKANTSMLRSEGALLTFSRQFQDALEKKPWSCAAFSSGAAAAAVQAELGVVQPEDREGAGWEGTAARFCLNGLKQNRGQGVPRQLGKEAHNLHWGCGDGPARPTKPWHSCAGPVLRLSHPGTDLFGAVRCRHGARGGRHEQQARHPALVHPRRRQRGHRGRHVPLLSAAQQLCLAVN